MYSQYIDSTPKEFPAKVYYSAKRALTSHASGGNALIAATVLALIVANIPGIIPCMPTSGTRRYACR